jgi:hypothetical protein
LNVPLWVGKHNPNLPDGDSFFRPKGWPTLTAEGNEERLKDFRKGKAVCANTGGVVTVIDVDPRNGGDIEKVRALLARLGVRVFAEIASPSGGRHFYIAGHPSLPSVHSKPDNPKLPGFPGVDIQSFGCNVFLTGTQRPKYQGKGYTVVLDDLDALAEGDPAGSEAFAQWVAQQLATGAKENAKKRAANKSDFEFERAGPWTGEKPDARQQAYLDKVLDENAGTG